MNIHLVVVKPFQTYTKGEVIADTATIAAILASPHAGCVVRVNAVAPVPVSTSQGS